jgi:hypothetical protein
MPLSPGVVPITIYIAGAVALEVILPQLQSVPGSFRGCVKGTSLPQADFGETNIHVDI